MCSDTSQNNNQHHGGASLAAQQPVTAQVPDELAYREKLTHWQQHAHDW